MLRTVCVQSQREGRSLVLRAWLSRDVVADRGTTNDIPYVAYISQWVLPIQYNKNKH